MFWQKKFEIIVFNLFIEKHSRNKMEFYAIKDIFWLRNLESRNQLLDMTNQAIILPNCFCERKPNRAR